MEDKHKERVWQKGKGYFSLGAKEWLTAFSVALVAFLVFLPALSNNFVNWDDFQYVSKNPHIKSINVNLFKWMFTSFYSSNWYPLTWLSHSIDYAIWGLNPMGHHLTSIIFHGINTFLVVLIIIRLLYYVKHKTPSQIPPIEGDKSHGTPVYRSSSSLNLSLNTTWLDKSIIAGALTGLLFGIHPIHVESVAWISERKDVLYAFFFLLSILFYLRYTSYSLKKQKPVYYALCLIFFIFALMSKPMAVTLPLVLLILDIYPLGRLKFKSALSNPLPPIKTPPEPHLPNGGLGGFYGRKVFIEKIPFFLLSLASSVVTILAAKSGGTMVPFEGQSLGERVLIPLRALIFYLFKILWPTELSPRYPYPSNISFFNLEYIGALLLVVCITSFCIWSWKRQKIWLAAWTYYVVTLLPALEFIPVGEEAAAADRYTYLPSLGILILVGLGAAQLVGKFVSKKNRLLFRTLSIIAPIMIILILLSNLTIMQTRIWKDSITLWSHEIEQYPTAAIGYRGRAQAYLDLGENQKALDDLNRAIIHNPRYTHSYLIRANLFLRVGNYQKALEDLDKAIETNPEFSVAYTDRCGFYIRKGLHKRAIEDCSKALKINHRDAVAYNNRGLAFYALGEVKKAIKDFSEAISLNQVNPGFYRNRGIAYLKTGRNNEAMQDFQKAVKLGDSKTRELLREIGNSVRSPSPF